MLQHVRFFRVAGMFALAVCCAPFLLGQAKPASSGSPLVAYELGKGTVPLDGLWQFRLGDDMSWAGADGDDSNWEQLTADRPWGEQGHRSYSGFAWYRRHMELRPAEGAPQEFALLIPAIDDAYEIYWNGQRVGQLGSLPPKVVVYTGQPPQTYGLGPIRSGVLAVRVFKLPLGSNDDGLGGGFESAPIVGSPQAIADAKGRMDFQWLRAQQFLFALSALYGLVFLLILSAWWRDRSQQVFFWTASYSLMLMLQAPLFNLRLHWPFGVSEALRLAMVGIREISLWFLVLYLLRLDNLPRVVRAVRVMALVVFISCVLDGLLYLAYPSLIGAQGFLVADVALTAIYLPPQIMPVVLAVIAVVQRKRLDSVPWVVAALAFLNSAYYALVNASGQGQRYTHWTLAQRLQRPLFTVNGNPMNTSLILRALLFLSIVYAVIRYWMKNSRYQNALEQEFQNARELQQVLIPESLPEIPGFALTSAYKPALKVGGDFYQVIALESGSTLVVLGDVSGKGLKAAMAVSLIVGAVRTFVETTESPAETLVGLNRRLEGRLQGGFATAIALRLDRDGRCTLSSAGHPSPFLNGHEVEVPGALPLGMLQDASYVETSITLRVGDRLALYTDGLPEARNASGELYGFERLKTLFDSVPDAAQASEAAVAFGQDDDITVLTLGFVGQGAVA